MSRQDENGGLGPLPEPPPPKTFHQEAVDLFEWAGRELLRQHPEVRSIAASFDYYGDLNSAKIPSAVWIGRGPGGRVDTPDAILGAAAQLLKLQGATMERYKIVLQAREQQILEASRKLLELEQRLVKETQAEVDRTASGAVDQPASPREGS